ncbi:hypothetical protein psal_cds_966 [Pandoravirus salinus]|uniref:F-box domain containing protein n=1 Tax=Pandoravirus salinus TaxID=1349410 RepID=S4W018_9VIRU|nr:hypothetical protein psal_cds_966 [Pandoravirus salinus]AGO85121.2 hypothetical protein psal_cds_966 [Pandoravirus salinus]
MATCASLWRRLFIRDFSHLYNKGLPVAPWPHSDHPDDPWHEITVDFWRGTNALADMPPRCPPLAHLPAPFAHAFAAGKDWCWLYRVHARTVPEEPDASFSGPAAHWTSPTTVVRCDWIDGRAHGYVSHVTTSADRDEAIEWSEWMHDAADGRELWSVMCNATKIQHQAPADGLRGPYAFVFYRNGDRRWTTYNDSEPGAFVHIYASGTRCDGQHDAGAITLLSEHCIDGCAVTQIRNGKSHGVMQSFWHNGDTMSARYQDGEFVEVVDFVCSPTCPRTEYAGVRVVGCAWRRISIATSHTRGSYLAFVPDDDSDDARLFWRYVSDGLVGWDPRIRRTVLDTISAGSV